MTSVLISRPDQWLRPNHFMNMEDLRTFFVLLEEVLTSLRIEYEITSVIKKIIPTSHLLFAHHTYGSYNNVWHIKKGYVPGYIYFDRTGYSGWAEIANSPELFSKSQEANINVAREFVQQFVQHYTNTNTSKLPQTQDFVLPQEKYIFVVGQVPDDTVSFHANIKSDDLITRVVDRFADEITVVFKPHPIDLKRRPKYYQQLSQTYNVTMTNGSIHKIIPNAEAVFTVNSGVGFESLLHNKPVICSGHSDYHWVTTRIKSNEDLNRLQLSEIKQNDDQVIKFLFFMFTEYFVDVTSKESITTRVLQAIRESS